MFPASAGSEDKAREAEYLAEQVSDQAAKEVWLRIAQSYLDLAKLAPRGPKLS